MPSFERLLHSACQDMSAWFRAQHSHSLEQGTAQTSLSVHDKVAALSTEAQDHKIYDLPSDAQVFSMAISERLVKALDHPLPELAQTVLHASELGIIPTALACPSA